MFFLIVYFSQPSQFVLLFFLERKLKINQSYAGIQIFHDLHSFLRNVIVGSKWFGRDFKIFQISGFLQHRSADPPTSCIAGGQPAPRGELCPGQTWGNMFSGGSPSLSKGIILSKMCLSYIL